jgi:hypothetical protein
MLIHLVVHNGGHFGFVVSDVCGNFLQTFP